MNTIPQSYVLVSEYNEYDQHGAYFIAWFHQKPTTEEVCKALLLDDGAHSELFDYMHLAKHIIARGGRQGSENVWYTLKTVKSLSAPVAP